VDITTCYSQAFNLFFFLFISNELEHVWLTTTQELYEPLWDELLKISKANNFAIRGIWIADVVHQGHSGVLNENKLGNDRKPTNLLSPPSTTQH